MSNKEENKEIPSGEMWIELAGTVIVVVGIVGLAILIVSSLFQLFNGITGGFYNQ